jgi:hypothetical protein
MANADNHRRVVADHMVGVEGLMNEWIEGILFLAALIPLGFFEFWIIGKMFELR